jgi:RNA polymerase sigma-70 factor (sigma-E family)
VSFVDDAARSDFLTFVHARAGALFRVAYALAGQQQAAEDLVQASLEKMALRWRWIQDPEAYAKRVIYHEFVSWRRRRWVKEILTADLPDRAPTADPTRTVDLRQALVAALATLPPRQRAVLVLRYLEDHTDTEIARIMGCSRPTVSSQAHRALARLRARCPELSDAFEETRS